MKLSRRAALKTGFATAAMAPLAGILMAEQGPIARNGRIRQSACRWCYNDIPLDQLCAFAARIGVPVETVRNWEQGKRSPRGPARALLKVLEQAPEAAFAVLGKAR